jgi:hypothetical protein
MEAPKVEAARSGQGTGKLLSGVQRLKPDRASYLRQAIVYLALLVPSYAQSYVGGDLSSQAPYGVPPQVFSSAISSPVADASFPIRGYNTSIPPGGTDGTGSHIQGWSINVGVAENVPLTDSDYAGIDRDNKCIDAATLSITPPADIATCDEDGWRVCAVVFADGLGSAVAKDVQAKSDGSCSSLLPDDCIRKLQADGVAKGAKAKGSGCADLKIPDECASYFSGKDGTAYSEFCQDFLPRPSSSFFNLLTACDSETPQKSHPSEAQGTKTGVLRSLRGDPSPSSRAIRRPSHPR